MTNTRSRSMNCLYIKHTIDKYELPVAVADSTKELSIMTGKTEGSIRSMVSRKQNGYMKVVFNDEVPE